MKNNNYRILIVGCGELGSRFMQSIAKINNFVEVWCYDIQKSQFETCTQRIKQINPKKIKEFNFTDNLKRIPRDIDLCIITTTANHRLSALKSVLSVCMPTNILLEKILFQKLADYDEALMLLESSSLVENTYVHCPRREWDGYIQLKKEILNEEIISFSVLGESLRIATNSIHFIDLVQYLNQTPVKFKSSLVEIDERVTNRPSTIDFLGSLIVVDGNGSIINICSCKKISSPLLVKISTNQRTYVINEMAKNLSIIGQEGVCENRFFSTNMVSESDEFLLKFLDSEQVLLPKFIESIDAHKKVLTTIGSKLLNKKIIGMFDEVQIT